MTARPRSPRDPQGLPHPAFADFQLFDPALHVAPPPPPLPPSNELFSVSETSDIFGFLDNFDWDLNVDTLQQSFAVPADIYQNPLQETAPPGLDQLAPSSNLFSSQGDQHLHPPPPQPPQPQHQPQQSPTAPAIRTARPASPIAPPPEAKPRIRSPSRSPSTSSSRATPSAAAAAASRAAKPLLSTPQKRLNHIMSEQKRRNAIREGYMQLTTLLAPAGAPPGSGMPTRGRPKGSGSRGRGTKGKSGILFRAREYIYWLEEGRDALQEEVARLEAAAGIR